MVAIIALFMAPIFVDVIKLSPLDVSSFARVTTSYVVSLCISSPFYTSNKLLEFSQRSKSNYNHWSLFERTMRTLSLVNIVLCSLFPIKNMINGIHYGVGTFGVPPRSSASPWPRSRRDPRCPFHCMRILITRLQYSFA